MRRTGGRQGWWGVPAAITLSTIGQKKSHSEIDATSPVWSGGGVKSGQVAFVPYYPPSAAGCNAVTAGRCRPSANAGCRAVTASAAEASAAPPTLQLSFDNEALRRLVVLPSCKTCPSSIAMSVCALVLLRTWCASGYLLRSSSDAAAAGSKVQEPLRHWKEITAASYDPVTGARNAWSIWWLRTANTSCKRAR